LHRPRQRLHQLGRFLGWQRLAVELAGEGAARDELQGAVGVATNLADLVNLDDVGVLQARHRLRLDAEAGQLAFAGVTTGEDHLQRHGALELQVQGFVDDAMPPRPSSLSISYPGTENQRREGRSLAPGPGPAGAPPWCHRRA